MIFKGSRLWFKGVSQNGDSYLPDNIFWSIANGAPPAGVGATWRINPFDKVIFNVFRTFTL